MSNKFTLPSLLFSAIALVFFATSAQAQIPNAGFEEWVMNDIWTEEPAGWETNNIEGSSFVTKDSDAYEGQYSMRVETEMYENYARTTFPINAIPPSLDFYVKTSAANGIVRVEISFFNNDILFSTHDWIFGDTLTEWTPVELALEQIDPVLTHAVVKVSANVGDFAPGHAIILIDNMGFSTISGVEEIDNRSASVYPNPCEDVLYVEGVAPGTEYIMRDITGREVATGRTGAHTTSVDVSGLNTGVYLMKLGSGVNESIRKIIVR